METNLRDLPSLQNGWKLYMNYCMGCHSAAHQRYNRFARDAGLTDEQVVENLIFTEVRGPRKPAVVGLR